MNRPNSEDPFVATRARFQLPDGLVYLDGNSLGPLSVDVPARVERMLREEWGKTLIGGWNQCGWMEASRLLGDRIARLIGAPDGSVIVGDTLTIRMYQALAAALALRPERHVILSDSGNFPADLYMAEGLIDLIGGTHDLQVTAPGDISAAISPETAVVMLTEVDYRTGRRHDMARITAEAHAAGALVIWDLAHSAGALPVDLAGAGADFAAGCTYKYLNGGPGAPAFLYVAPEHQERAKPALAGWLGHAAPFAFELTYRPAPGIDRMRIGTPPVVAMAALEAALDVWSGVSIAAVRERSIALSERLIAEVEARCPALTLASPRDPEARGSQVSFRHPEGYAVMQALIAEGVIGDFRAPDIMRFGIAPLYVSADDILTAATILERILRDRLWDRPEFRARKAVT